MFLQTSIESVALPLHAVRRFVGSSIRRWDIFAEKQARILLLRRSAASHRPGNLSHQSQPATTIPMKTRILACLAAIFISIPAFLRRAFQPLRLKACLLFLIASMPSLPIHSQEQTAQANAEKPARNFQVLKRREVVVGDHTITYQLVAPPQTPAPVAPTPAARVLSPAELEVQRRREAKQHAVLFFSATTLDHRVTELRWLDNGKSYRAFSNIDFQTFSGLTEIETADAVCTLMMAFDTGTAEALAERTREVPQLALLPNDRSAWLLMEGSAEEGASTVNAWDSIHRFFDAHREEMIRGHQQREVARAERERLERENPQPPKKTVISYWRKGNTTAHPKNQGAPK